MHRQSVMRSALVTAMALSTGLTAPGSFAQVLEEVLVTARKREENLQQVAVSVSVLSSQTISDAGLVRLTDISQLVPNMTNQENISNKFTNVTLRGLSSSGGLGNDPGIGVYVDEVYVARESGFRTVASCGGLRSTGRTLAADRHLDPPACRKYRPPFGLIRQVSNGMVSCSNGVSAQERRPCTRRQLAFRARSAACREG